MQTSMSYAVFLEPRGFIKVLEFVFVICAFACACDFKGDVVLKVKCSSDINVSNTTSTTTVGTTSTTTVDSSSTTTVDSSSTTTVESTSTTTVESTSTTPIPEILYTAEFKYPFKLYKSESNSAISCNGTEETMTLEGDYSSTACFYVFVGVFSFLFTIFAVVVYVFFQPTYEFMEWIPITDTVVHGVLTVFWFGASIAWASALTGIKKHTKTDLVAEENPDICLEALSCTVDKIEYQLLDFSVIFGFLNVLLFGLNVWFVFKETKFFGKATPPSTQAT
ncbi:synaptophysin-like protein 1 [Hyalella azteca]|uniref:Synaptophysin-like protein 1 n=1 Tax=Hyalella azteca TaxID=294128 RepID=A0A8B7P698_HYAAZ|nr:synaptophysin-like protein 1 [Hyalella azteca]